MSLYTAQSYGAFTRTAPADLTDTLNAASDIARSTNLPATVLDIDGTEIGFQYPDGSFDLAAGSPRTAAFWEGK